VETFLELTALLAAVVAAGVLVVYFFQSWK
jgi:hypothetical protein